ncbi:protein Skeletor, isoforms B/C [Bradysia coprophila]|uniref:protein Skeletor, isoforms B/C n=1 Tax=Bradysia coprophila TaxID=38358 RepID=UPI00187DB1CC|nr:protein Skeletor, isoforms B/C [Bradysia coprophila]
MCQVNSISCNGFKRKLQRNLFIVAVCLCSLVLGNVRVVECDDIDDDDGPYRGKLVGTFNTYHHQVTGSVYAVDEFTFLLSGFSYDGNGVDTFFWAGASNRPGPQGFIVPDEYGHTNVLERYFNKDFTLKLPDDKKITEIKWFAVYDLNNQNNFGDIYIPEEFEPPTPQKGNSFSKKSRGVSSANIEILDSKTIKIPELFYDGTGKRTYFWAGVGPQPSSKGVKIPDEMGYLDPIRKYEGETVTLELPGDTTVFNIDWISIFDLETNENFGSSLIQSGLNVPPSLVQIQPHTAALPNCRQLHKNYRVSWEVFGPQITIQLAGLVNEDEYMSFGISGSETSSQMLGADVVVAYIDGFRGYATDYNITSLAPCVQVLGQNKGVCRDDVVGGLDSFQIHTHTRENGINTITFRRTLISSDNGDKEFRLDQETYVVWAMGRLDSNNEPAFHDIYPKKDVIIHFNTSEPVNDCFSFSKSETNRPDIWDRAQIFERSIRTFTTALGPAGGKRGYAGITGHVSNGLAWYINGLLVPELWLRRGLTYEFKVRGGNNPHSPEYYHPLVITDEPRGGFDRLTEAKQNEIRVLAGVEFTRRGRPKPTAVGPLCLGKHPDTKDRRLDDTYATFKKFNRTLRWSCEAGDPAILQITPNTSWPDTVYYNSFTHANMGWKIHIVDSYNKNRGGKYGAQCIWMGLLFLFFI